MFPITTPQVPSLDFKDLDTNDYLILNHLLLIIKMYIQNARTTDWLIEYKPSAGIYKGTKDTKKKLCENDTRRRKKEMEKCFNKLTEVN